MVKTILSALAGHAHLNITEKDGKYYVTSTMAGLLLEPLRADSEKEALAEAFGMVENKLLKALKDLERLREDTL